MSYKSPFSGLKVVDLSQGIAGPYCAMLLAQYGADVIKVEPPEGDWSRYFGPNWGGHTPFSIAGNLQALGNFWISKKKRTKRVCGTFWIRRMFSLKVFVRV